jgi:Holliday junction resolvase-like predicted endonuclease
MAEEGSARQVWRSRQSQDLDYVYLFVTRKSEVLLCQDYIEEIQQSLRIRVFGEFTRFRDVFAYLTDLSRSKPFTLIIDEFQEFSFINPAILSEMQEIWDRSKRESRMHLIISGSVYRLMKKIFENAKEPLFGRSDERIHLQPFGPGTLLEIIRDFHESFEPIDLLCFYCVTGGVPKYVELLADKNALSIEQIRDEFFRPNSFWLVEGKTLLIEEFGKDYTIYFSILSLIASGKTGRTEIESVLEKNIGGYLERLINDFEIIRVVKPIFTKPLGKVQKYEIIDHFLKFWFRFIFKYKSAVEINNFDYLKTIFNRDFKTFAGKQLEQWFIQQWMVSKQYSAIGSYWDRKNNEIDIVAVDDLNKRITFAEVKMNRQNLKLSELKNKASLILAKRPEYTAEYKMLSLEDMV